MSGHWLAPEINLRISSRGGDVFDGIAICNALRTHPSRVVATVDSLAASIASVIAQAADHRITVSGSQMMIHEAFGLALGGADEVVKPQTQPSSASAGGRTSAESLAEWTKLLAASMEIDSGEFVDAGLTDWKKRFVASLEIIT